MFDSCFVQLKFDYDATKNVDVDHIVDSEEVSAGGNSWWINCYPRRYAKADKGEYVLIYLQLNVSKSKSVKAIFEAFPVDRDGEPSSSHAERLVKVYPIEGFATNSWGWPQFVKRSDLDPRYVVNGCVTIMCGVIVVSDDCPLSVLPSDISDHLLTAADGSDVSFVVGGKTFPAHRAVLAARSPVFKAELFGSMAEATMSCITLQDIDAATFQVLLRFMYTDVLFRDDNDDELGDGDDSPIEMYQRLLAAADRYAMDRLKMMCASKLWDNVSVDTVADVLACAETYSCPELKEKCVGFLVDDKNFKKAVLTDGFVKLVQRFPSFIAELREKAGT